MVTVLKTEADKYTDDAVHTLEQMIVAVKERRAWGAIVFLSLPNGEYLLKKAAVMNRPEMIGMLFQAQHDIAKED